MDILNDQGHVQAASDFTDLVIPFQDGTIGDDFVVKPLPASIRTQINSNPDFHDDLGGCHEEDSVFHGGGGGCEDWSYSDVGGGSGNPYDISGNSFVYERRRTNETDDYEFLDEVRAQ